MRIFKLFCALAIVLFVFLYGISVGLYQQFPFEQILSVKEFIIKALDKHRGKRKNAAKELGISERTLYRKIKEYGIQ